MYKVYFEDNTVFDGGTLNNSKWNEIPDKPIRKIEYKLLSTTIKLEGYESYNHLLEMCSFITGGVGLGTNYKRLTKIILMGKRGDVVDAIVYNLLKKKAFKETLKAGQEYNNRPSNGWKTGLYSTPSIKLL